MPRLEHTWKARFLLALFLLTTLFACTKKKDDGALHLVIFENPKSLDPIQANDALASDAVGGVYETLLQYHYLKRPYVLTTSLAEEMPRYSADGLTVTLKIKAGVKFQDDPCFKDGRGRELVSTDFIYAFKRLADPKNQSDGWWVFDGKIEGLDQWRETSLKNGSADYGAAIPGLRAIDDHTLQIRLKKKYPQFNYILATKYTAPMAHEAVEKYGPEIGNHPVGTGPFIITEYVRGSHITFEKNKSFHGENFPLPDELRAPASTSDEDCTKKKVVATPTPKPKFDPSSGCKVSAIAGHGALGVIKTSSVVAGDFDYGKALPLTDKIVLHIFLERQPAWLEFMKGGLDQIVLPKDNFGEAIGPDHLLKKELREKGIKLSKDESTTEWFLGFNMEDPVLGKNKYLRKAIGYAYNSQRDIELFTNGRGTAANQILPPLINGFVKGLPSREFNLAKARDALARAGYPDGKGLAPLTFDVSGDSQERQRGEFFKSQMAQIGIEVKVRTNTRPELFDRRKKGQVQIEMDGWIADYPDAENFLQLLYGPNKSPGPNNSSFDNAEFNRLYEKIAAFDSSSDFRAGAGGLASAGAAERQKLIDRATEIFLEESPWIPNWIATIYNLHQDHLKNYLYSDFSHNDFKYYGLRR